ncbi:MULTISPECIES: S8 family serine peptidase [unclassified Solwaraspora]|uniref:S8 family serine peptidase n=1 Tax=unclassified Solwaraspora TaxID=2627926 RepID=UPI00248D0668|nr:MULTISPECIES: S8 family serine peptidase [unclassified Solwaraspora]WBB97212.1 S8 family serine peptidase [Solwaraspora sp. WMMA2059]WBC18886.1 S8 family serine peptidase [Solwaraspora sp. WMMA2080]WJK33711.1 S8 family serine peptidase [Solwaraspora sp. WMMA2065]
MNRHLARVVLTGLATLVAVTAATTEMVTERRPARATPADSQEQPYVLYYTVMASYQGKPESLWSVAERFLGDAERAGEILALNAGRQQPDGGRLSDPGQLNEGWHLVLPWDAIGTGLRHGALPTTTAAEPGATASPEPAGSPKPADSPRPSGSLNRPAGPASAPVRSTAPPAGEPTGSGSTASDHTGCRPAAVADPPADSNWGQQLVAPQRVWRTATGAGVSVAVVDSGVAAGRPELGDRLGRGVDIVSGRGQGDTDCVGSGTALAGIVAADDGRAGDLVGVAPKAVVIPVRLVDRGVAASPPAAVTAIEVAVATGAKVILLGVSVDVADPSVRSAIDEAIGWGAVVVAPAPAAEPAITSGDGLLRVGGLGPDQRPIADYPAGSVDLLAPAAGIRSISATGTGAHVGTGPEYAAAFVAGAAALVRSAHPGLSGEQTGRQLVVSADRPADAGPESVGRLDPYAAVTGRLVDERLPATVLEQDERSQPVPWSVVLAVLAVLGALFAGGRLWGRYQAARRRRWLALERADDPFDSRAEDADQLVHAHGGKT